MAKKKATKKAAKKKTAARKTAAKKAVKRPTTKKAAAKSTAKKSVKKTSAAARKKTTKVKKAATRSQPRKTKKKAAAAHPPSQPQNGGMPKVGALAPDFELMDGAGQTHRLSGYRGKHVVLYFYPKDDTPGCTREACGFRDTLSEFAERNAIVLGVSPDTVESHRKFAAKFSLPFPLLADPDRAVAQHYGAYGQKMMYGKPVMGIKRSTFIIDPNGRIEQVFANVKADGHEMEVLRYLDEG